MQQYLVDMQNKTRKMCRRIHRPGKHYCLMTMGILWTFNFLRKTKYRDYIEAL